MIGLISSSCSIELWRQFITPPQVHNISKAWYQAILLRSSFCIPYIHKTGYKIILSTESDFIFPMGKVSTESLQLQSTAAGIWDACEARAIAAILLPLAMVGVRELMKRFGLRLSKK